MTIADDFTGALNMEVHFTGRGIRTRMIVSLDHDGSWEEGIRSRETTVLAIDAETRHVSPSQACRKVSAIEKDVREAGILYIYKETDSAPRGNTGSELEAAYHTAGESFLSLIPALSQINRTTRGGRQYIDGMPADKNMFDQNPFEPVTKDSVKNIIRLQSEIPTIETYDEARPGPGQAGIVVYDTITGADIKRIGTDLTVTGQSRLMTGCAGFVAILPDLLGLRRQEPETTALECGLFMICGSVNPTTRGQLG